MAEQQETTAPFIPNYSFAPENFRRIMTRQIGNTVDTGLDSVLKFSQGNADGRFSSSLPAKTYQIQNANGYYYFVVGFSRVGSLAVAAP